MVLDEARGEDATEVEAEVVSSRSFRLIRCVRADVFDGRSGTIEVSFGALVIPFFGTGGPSREIPESLNVLEDSVLRFFFLGIALSTPEDDGVGATGAAAASEAGLFFFG